MADGRIIVIDPSGASSPHLLDAAAQGAPLSRLLFEAGYWRGAPLCAGLGKCGRCRVRLEVPAGADLPAPTPDDGRFFSAEELRAGWRLACRHTPQDGLTVVLPAQRPYAGRLRSGGTLQGAVSLAVDLGTTSVEWRAWDAGGGLATGKFLNPQMGAGAEVMSRLAYAVDPGQAARLRAVVLDALAGICAGLGSVTSLAVAGNSVMTCLLAGTSTRGLRAAPYRLEDDFGREADLDDRLPAVYLPPLLAPFVGGDLSAGLTWLVRSGPEPGRGVEYPFVLADMGTNGEFILALSEDDFLAASVPLGPALEGVGLSCGRVAGPGAWSGFALGPAGLTPRVLPGDVEPGEAPGLTGTGYLSLLAALLRLGLLDVQGHFLEPSTPLARRVAAGFGTFRGEPALDVGAGMHLTASDVEETLKVKAAFNLALSRLLTEAGLRFADLRAVYLAGALGRHAETADLTTLGFLPDGGGERVRAVGNSSLAGAELFLLSPAAREWAKALPAKCRVLDLAASSAFEAEFIARMRFGYV